MNVLVAPQRTPFEAASARTVDPDLKTTIQMPGVPECYATREWTPRCRECEWREPCELWSTRKGARR